MRPQFRDDFSPEPKKEVQASLAHFLIHTTVYLFFSCFPPPLSLPLSLFSLLCCVGSLSQRDGLQQPALHPDFQAFPHLHPQQSRPQQQAEGTRTSLPLLTCHLFCPFASKSSFFFFFDQTVNSHVFLLLCVRRISTCPYLWMMMTLSANRCRLSSCSLPPFWPETQKFLYLCCFPPSLTVPPVV